MSCVYRVFVLIFLMLLTACATCSILFPIFRKPKSKVGNTTTKETVYYWYSETSHVDSVSTSIKRVYTRDYSCESEKNDYVASAALAVAGAGLGGLACMFVACWINAGYRAALGVISVILTFLAFACCIVVVSLSAYLFVNVPCKSDSVTESVKQRDYKLVEGFILMAIAAGGFLIMMVVQIIGLCCCFCGHSNFDDVSSDLGSRSSKSRSDDDDFNRCSSRDRSLRN